MADKRTIKFGKPALKQRLARMLLQRRIPFAVSKDGTVRYSKRFDELIESEILPPLRQQAFPRWQVLSFPREWATTYADYMQSNKIQFVREWIDGELVYVLSAKYRPHTWNLPDPVSEKPPLADIRRLPIRRAVPRA